MDGIVDRSANERAKTAVTLLLSATLVDRVGSGEQLSALVEHLLGRHLGGGTAVEQDLRERSLRALDEAHDRHGSLTDGFATL